MFVNRRLSLVAFALCALAIALCGCSVDQSWKVREGDKLTTVYEKLGLPTEIIYTELYWRAWDGRNVWYVKLDRCPEFRGWMVQKGGKVEQVVMLPEAFVVKVVYNPYGHRD